MYGVLSSCRYLKLNGETTSIPTYPFETPAAAYERAKSALLIDVRWKVVDEHDFPIDNFHSS